MTRTKIIATLGPATADKAVIERLMLLGLMFFASILAMVIMISMQSLSKMYDGLAEQLDRPIALLQDISGPKSG